MDVVPVGPQVRLPSATIGLGPVKWHRYCSRYHAARADCGLVQEERIAKSGKKVTRWVHPIIEKPKRKIRARKS